MLFNVGMKTHFPFYTSTSLCFAQHEREYESFFTTVRPEQGRKPSSKGQLIALKLAFVNFSTHVIYSCNQDTPGF